MKKLNNRVTLFTSSLLTSVIMLAGLTNIGTGFNEAKANKSKMPVSNDSVYIRREESTDISKILNIDTGDMESHSIYFDMSNDTDSSTDEKDINKGVEDIFKRQIEEAVGVNGDNIQKDECEKAEAEQNSENTEVKEDKKNEDNGSNIVVIRKIKEDNIQDNTQDDIENETDKSATGTLKALEKKEQENVGSGIEEIITTEETKQEDVVQESAPEVVEVTPCQINVQNNGASVVFENSVRTEINYIPQTFLNNLSGWTVYVTTENLAAKFGYDYSIMAITDYGSRAVYIAEGNPAYVIDHEIGHVVSYERGNLHSTAEFDACFQAEHSSMLNFDNTHPNNVNTPVEYFAEAFQEYMKDTGNMQVYCPSTYNYFAGLQ